MGDDVGVVDSGWFLASVGRRLKPALSGLRATHPLTRQGTTVP
jgi:hypothetical protein